MTAIFELLRLFHFGRQEWSVRQCERDLERIRRDLALAIDARDAALAAIRAAEPAPRPLPASLLRKPAL